jgi:hypothetical protein
MGISYKVFIVENEDRLLRIPLKQYEALIRSRQIQKPFPEYANQKIRYALVVTALENQKLMGIVRIYYGYISF